MPSPSVWRFCDTLRVRRLPQTSYNSGWTRRSIPPLLGRRSKIEYRSVYRCGPRRRDGKVLRLIAERRIRTLDVSAIGNELSPSVDLSPRPHGSAEPGSAICEIASSRFSQNDGSPLFFVSFPLKLLDSFLARGRLVSQRRTTSFQWATIDCTSKSDQKNTRASDRVLITRPGVILRADKVRDI